MKLSYCKYNLEFKHPFAVSSNIRKNTPVVFVKIEAAGKTGYGEACLPAYLGGNVHETISFLENAKEILKNDERFFSVHEIMERVDRIPGQNNEGKAAVNIALNDLYGKIGKIAFYDHCGFGKSAPKYTSFTIGIDTEEITINKIKEAEDFLLLKIKGGTADDKALINMVRKHTDKALYLDANQGWKDKHESLDLLHWLKEQNVLLVEQPMPVAMVEETAWLKTQSPIPLIADESVKTYSDLEKLKGVFSGVNIKLMKCGGLDEALKMISFCKKNNLKIMLGCMAESSCGVSAMAQLMKMADYVDLDAPNLYKNDPFTGISYKQGKIHLNDLPGIGVAPKQELF